MISEETVRALDVSGKILGAVAVVGGLCLLIAGLLFVDKEPEENAHWREGQRGEARDMVNTTDFTDGGEGADVESISQRAAGTRESVSATGG